MQFQSCLGVEKTYWTSRAETMVTVKPHHSIINVTARKVMICKMNIRQWHIKFKIFLRKCTDKEKQPLIILGAFITLTFLFVINSSLRRETVEETRMMCKPKSLLEGTEIRNRSSAKSKDSKHILQISSAFDHMLKWKDPCMVWFGECGECPCKTHTSTRTKPQTYIHT